MFKLNQILIALMVFVGGFVGTVATRYASSQTTTPSQPCSLERWLRLDSDQAARIQELKPDFEKEVARLRQELRDARSELINLFENDQTTDEELRQQIETVIQTHNQVERYVADYLIAVRKHLTPAQQNRLFSLCAENVRYCWRQQQWRQAQDGEEQAPGFGRGPGWGHRSQFDPQQDSE